MIRSNVKGVIGKLERFQAGLPGAMERAIAPKKWHLPLKNAARMALQAVALPGEERWIPFFAEAVTGSVFQQGVRWTLHTGALDSVPQVNVAQAAMEEGHGSRGRRVPAEQGAVERQQIEGVREGILEWVKEEKRRDPIDDAGLSDAELADRIEWIIGVHPRSKSGNRTAGMRDAGEGLAEAVQAFLEEKAGQKSVLPPKRVRVWLQAVLVAWEDKLLAELGISVKQEIAALWRNSGEKLF